MNKACGTWSIASAMDRRRCGHALCRLATDMTRSLHKVGNRMLVKRNESDWVKIIDGKRPGSPPQAKR